MLASDTSVSALSASALPFRPNGALNEHHRNALGRTLSEICHQRFRHGALSDSLIDSEVECRRDAPRIPCTPRRSMIKSRRLVRIVGEAHLRAPTVGRRMVQSEWQVPQSLRKRQRASSIAAARAVLKQCYGLLKRQHIKRDFVRPCVPIRKARRDEQPSPSGRQQVGNILWRVALS